MAQRRKPAAEVDETVAAKSEAEIELEEIQHEAKAKFSLRDRIVEGVTKRTKRIPLYLDLEKLEEAQAARAVVAESQSMLKFWSDNPDQYTAAITEREALLIEQEAELESVTQELLANTLSIHIKAVPRVAVKAARRKAKKVIAPKGKVPEDRQEDFDDLVTTNLLQVMILEIRDSSGNEYDIDPKAMQEELPDGQWGRVIRTMNQLILEDGVGLAATDDPGF